MINAYELSPSAVKSQSFRKAGPGFRAQSSQTGSQKTVEGFVNAIESIPEDKMQAQLKTISRTSESQYARRLASIVMGTHHETFSGAYFNATASIGYLLDPEVARLLSTGMNPSEILEGNNSVYIQIPTADLMYADGIGRMIVDAIVIVPALIVLSPEARKGPICACECWV
ncbi:MAG: type IV secretory system conjugative DNA transfer family protein [Rhodopila sp.]